MLLREVRLDPMLVMPAQIERPNIIQSKQKIVEDEWESEDGIRTLNTHERQAISQPVIVHSSLDAIVVVCDEIRTMDLQTNSHNTPRKHNQTSVV